jgi:hypothetical protein
VAHHMHNFEAIRAAKVKVIFLRGEASGDAYYARTAPIIAELTGGTSLTVPGNHLAFTLAAEPFAKAVLEAISHARSAEGEA